MIVVTKKPLTLLEMVLVLALLGTASYLSLTAFFPVKKKQIEKSVSSLDKTLSEIRALTKTAQTDAVAVLTNEEKGLFLQVYPQSWRYPEKRFTGIFLDHKEKKELFFFSDGTQSFSSFAVVSKDRKRSYPIDLQQSTSIIDYEKSPLLKPYSF